MPARSALDIEGQLPPPLRTRSGRFGALSDAVALIPDGAMVYAAGLMGTPTKLLQAMAENFSSWRNLTTTSDYLLEPLATFARPEDVAAPEWPFHHVTVQPSRATGRLAVDRLRTVSAHSSQFYRLFQPGGPLAVDVALVQVSEPGPDGRFSLGVSGGAALEVVCRAELVIAEVNPAMPWIRGPSAFERDAFDLLVEVDHPLLTLPPAPASTRPTPDSQGDLSRSAIIGALVAAEVENGSTIEYGIGTIPDAAIEALSGHEALGLHSGLIGDAAMALIDAGVMDGSAKTVDAGLHVASAVLGTVRAVEWVRGRDDVVIVASNYSHGVPTLNRQQRFVAINSAIEVSLDGSEGDTSTVRSVFFIDPANKIRTILTYPKSVGRNFDEILRVVDALQATDAHPIATPADWQPGDRVIVPPTMSTEEAGTKLANVEELKPYLRYADAPSS